MCCGVAQPSPLGGLCATVCPLHPTPSSPGVNTKPKAAMSVLLGNGKEKLQRTSLRRVSVEVQGSLVCNSALS